MPAVSDHVRRDAEHAARVEIGLALAKYQRRLYEKAKADIARDIESLAGGTADGTGIGRNAATAALGIYLGSEVHEPVEAPAHRVLDSGQNPRL